jgi:hypothetical protein
MLLLLQQERDAQLLAAISDRRIIPPVSEPRSATARDRRYN